MPRPPSNPDITLEGLYTDPYAIYRRLRAKAPVTHVPQLGRTLITRAADTKSVRTRHEIFSADDPDTPMKRAFHAHTLMRKDGTEHRRERMAMVRTFTPQNIRDVWGPAYAQAARGYLDALPRDEPVDLFPALAGPLAARALGMVMGIPQASDADLQHWSQALIDGAGNFAWDPAVFDIVDRAHDAMNAMIAASTQRLLREPDQSALSIMVNADDPIPDSQITANIKIAIGGGINEPRDALLTMLYGLLTNPDQRDQAIQSQNWAPVVEEAVRWVAPIQVSARRATEDTDIGGYDIQKDEVILLSQASANRDEAVFENPEQFDINRPDNPHQSFGGGPHHCIGANLTRHMLGDILLPMLFDRFPNMRLIDADRVPWGGFAFRGPLSLPVILT